MCRCKSWHLFCCGHVNYKMCIFGSNKWVSVCKGIIQHCCDMIVLTEREKETNLIPSDSSCAHTNPPLCRYLTHAHSHIHLVVAAMDSCFSSAWHNRWTPVESFRTRLWPCRGPTAMPCRWALRKSELTCPGYPGGMAVRMGRVLARLWAGVGMSLAFEFFVRRRRSSH